MCILLASNSENNTQVRNCGNHGLLKSRPHSYVKGCQGLAALMLSENDVAGWNGRGLTLNDRTTLVDTKVQQLLFHSLNNRLDIVCLIETHQKLAESKIAIEDVNKEVWTFHLSGDLAEGGLGVGFLVSPKVFVKEFSPRGPRLCSLSITPNPELVDGPSPECALISVYAPTEANGTVDELDEFYLSK